MTYRSNLVNEISQLQGNRNIQRVMTLSEQATPFGCCNFFESTTN